MTWQGQANGGELWKINDVVFNYDALTFSALGAYGYHRFVH